MFRTSERLAVACAGMALVLTACTDPVFGPTAQRVVGMKPANAASAHPALHSNSVRYRDNGAKPGTGRSGSASIMVRALVGHDGSTDVEVTTGELDSPAPPPGSLAKVQTKGLNGTTLLWTSNHNGLTGGGYAKFTYTSLARGSDVQVQANVRGIDPRRTDVVTVTTAVKWRPDLRASNLTAPSQAPVATPVVISAVVSEANGDVGATGNCVLYVGGVEADRANGVWVDAGDAVSCAFTQSFGSTGTKSLEVRVENVVPGDDNAANNSVSGSIDIVDPASRMSFYAYAYDQVYTQHYYSYNLDGWVDGSMGSQWGWDTKYDTSYFQYSYVTASAPQLLTLPIHVEASAESNGGTLHSIAMDVAAWDNAWVYNDPVWGYRQSCTSRTVDQVNLYLCTVDYDNLPYDYTHVQYDRSAQTVTYISRNYHHVWSSGHGNDYDFYYYDHRYECDPCEYGGGTQSWGPTLTMHVSISDATSRWVADPVIPLSLQQEYRYDEPETCYTYRNDGVFKYESCARNTYWWKSRWGEAYN